jgi:hypothetical protein
MKKFSQAHDDYAKAKKANVMREITAPLFAFIERDPSVFLG